MKRCLVTGGAGFIGSHLVERLVSGGCAVRVLDDFSTGKRLNLSKVTNTIDLITGSVIDARAVRAAVSSCDVIYHLAALPSVVKSVEDPLGCHQICATGTLEILDAARKAGVRRVVYAGSSSAYGDQPGTSRSEDDMLMPLSPYAAAKLAGEHYCTSCGVVYGLETVRLRFFNVFGPRQDAKSPYSGVIALFIDALRAGRQPTIFGDGLQARDFVYVENVVNALCLAADSPKSAGKVYNIGSGKSTTIIELMDNLKRNLGSRITANHVAARAGDVRNSEADISRARQDLGYDPSIGFEEGLRRTLGFAADAEQ